MTPPPGVDAGDPLPQSDWPAASPGTTRVKGRIEIANAELDDLVIARPDGTPTYNFCVVVDDLDMRITHVIRGDDHVNNTPRQINIIARARRRRRRCTRTCRRCWRRTGEKLSKRHGAVSVLQYRDDGYLPEAMVNFLARLGWAHGDDEIFTRDEFVDWFDLAGLRPSPARFDPDKLQLGEPGAHEADGPGASSARGSCLTCAQAGLDPAARSRARRRWRRCCATASRTLAEMADAAHYFYATPHPSRRGASPSTSPTPIGRRSSSCWPSSQTIDWTREALGAALKAAAARHGLKPPQVMMAMRVLVARHARDAGDRRGARAARARRCASGLPPALRAGT